MPEPLMIEVRHRAEGTLLVRMPLYEFLLSSYGIETPEEYPFAELSIVVGDQELYPSRCAQA